MTPALFVTYRDTQTLYTYTDGSPEEAIAKASAEYISAKQHPDVVSVVGGYLVCNVRFLDDPKERTYTYHCSQWYRPDTKVWVPAIGRDGKPCEKQVRVLYTCIRTRQELEQVCSFDRYKSVCED